MVRAMADPANRKRKWALPLAALAGALALAAVLGGGDRGAPAEPPPAPLSGETVAACREALAALERIGTIRERPEPGRLVVEEALWAAMPWRDKQNVLGAEACDRWRALLPPEGERVSAWGYRNGERLLTLSASGAVY